MEIPRSTTKPNRQPARPALPDGRATAATTSRICAKNCSITAPSLLHPRVVGEHLRVFATDPLLRPLEVDLCRQRTTNPRSRRHRSRFERDRTFVECDESFTGGPKDRRHLGFGYLLVREGVEPRLLNRQQARAEGSTNAPRPRERASNAGFGAIPSVLERRSIARGRADASTLHKCSIRLASALPLRPFRRDPLLVHEGVA
jgi:hypothetical protein